MGGKALGEGHNSTLHDSSMLTLTLIYQKGNLVREATSRSTTSLLCCQRVADGRHKPAAHRQLVSCNGCEQMPFTNQITHQQKQPKDNCPNCASNKHQMLDRQSYLGAGIVKDAGLWLVSLHRGDVDDSTALGHMLHCILGNGEVCQDVGVESSLQSGTVNLLKLLNQFALEGSVVDQDVNAAPLLDSLVYNVPASRHDIAQDSHRLVSISCLLAQGSCCIVQQVWCSCTAACDQAKASLVHGRLTTCSIQDMSTFWL